MNFIESFRFHFQITLGSYLSYYIVTVIIGWFINYFICSFIIFLFDWGGFQFQRIKVILANIGGRVIRVKRFFFQNTTIFFYLTECFSQEIVKQWKTHHIFNRKIQQWRLNFLYCKVLIHFILFVTLIFVLFLKKQE